MLSKETVERLIITVLLMYELCSMQVGGATDAGSSGRVAPSLRIQMRVCVQYARLTHDSYVRNH